MAVPMGPGQRGFGTAVLYLTACLCAASTAEEAAASKHVAPTAPVQEKDAVSKDLKAWANFQPADAALGSLVLQSLRAGPSDEPMPAEGDPALDPCPVLNEWPDKVEVEAPNPCNLLSSGGSWTSAAHAGSNSNLVPMMTWTQQCSAFGGGPVPVTTYTLPSGGVFGTSQLVPSLTGNTLRLNDCVGYTKYLIDEKVYQVPGEPDPHACELYNSCSGSIFLQYIIRDHAGRTLAQTPVLRLFQSSFAIEDRNGMLVAQVERLGHWNPMSKTCLQGKARKWLVKFPDLASPGSSLIFPTAADRWPVAELVTVMATRDSSRLASGLVAPSVCEAEKTGLMIVVVLFFFAVVAVATLLFLKVGVGSMQMVCLDFEGRFCPRRMMKPTRPPKPYTV
eukprot:gb/GFBE01039761.1/.p1 GENE.gb/GFBE01039761.1/~~gb/GFBE01039761.1/.p1  ORF type:complete len:392 (+),score=87.70 gb/GFBE01039761.1/:1-1176(+)